MVLLSLSPRRVTQAGDSNSHEPLIFLSFICHLFEDDGVKIKTNTRCFGKAQCEDDALKLQTNDTKVGFVLQHKEQKSWTF